MTPVRVDEAAFGVRQNTSTLLSRDFLLLKESARDSEIVPKIAKRSALVNHIVISISQLHTDFLSIISYTWYLSIVNSNN